MPIRKKSQYKMIVFDLDGTLADSMEAGLDAMNQLRFLFGYKKLQKDDPNLRLMSGADFVKEILNLNILQMIAWVKLLKFLVNRQAHRIGIYKGWKSVLKTLKKKYALGLVTSAPQKYTRTILKNAHLNSIFDFVITDVKYHRKDQSLKKILETNAIKPNEILYVGDELRDLTACQKQGVPFLAVSWGKDHENVFKTQLKKMAGLIRNPSDLLTGRIL